MIKRINKKDIFNVMIIFAIITFIILFLIKKTYVYGSVVDWTDQHFNIPDYFRTLFYNTHQLTPSFAFNIGSGENIFYLSYYGLLSPIILLSYFFPMVSMANYIIATSIISIYVSSVLMYIFLRKNYHHSLSLLGTLLFICATPIIFHSHRHIMFVNYMPFLLMGMLGVKRYFHYNKSGLLIISVFLIIMTSYYYSVGSIIGLTLYGIYEYFTIEKNKTIKNFLKAGAQYIIRLIIPILSSCVLIIPTLYTLLNGRTDTLNQISLSQLLIPTINYDFVLYDSYGMGLTYIFFFAIIVKAFSNELKDKILGIFFSLAILFPIVVFMMNGGMYAYGKCLIPMIPLAIFMLVDTLSKISLIENKKYKIILGMFGFVSLIMIINILKQNNILYCIDIILTTIVFILYYFYKKNILIYLPTAVMALTVCIIVNSSDSLVLRETFAKENADIEMTLPNDVNYRINNNYYALNNVNHIYNPNYKTTTIYSSVANRYYKDFYFKYSGNEIRYRNNSIISPVNNLYFNTLMGVKTITSKSNIVGYEKEIDGKRYNLYTNKNVYPIGFASSNLLNTDSYNQLVYPYSMEALTKTIITDNTDSTTYQSDITKIDLKTNSTNFWRKENGIYIIDIKKETESYQLKLNNKFHNQYLLIQFDMDYQESCSVGDTYITINGVKNKLTCSSWTYQNNNNKFTYMINADSVINLKFSKGHYEISNLNTYVVNKDAISNLQNHIDKFIIDSEKTKGDKIIGDIDVTNDAFFMLTIPYDRGFTIKVDGTVVDYELVNTSFIGFPIKQGNHHIEIKYSALGLNIGKTLSIIGFVMLIGITCYERRIAKRKM